MPDGYDFAYVRDYEVANTRRLKEEFVLVFEDGPADDADVIAEPKPKRPRAAYYTALGEAQTLRKRRPRVSRVELRRVMGWRRRRMLILNV